MQCNHLNMDTSSSIKQGEALAFYRGGQRLTIKVGYVKVTYAYFAVDFKKIRGYHQQILDRQLGNLFFVFEPIVSFLVFWYVSLLLLDNMHCFDLTNIFCYFLNLSFKIFLFTMFHSTCKFTGCVSCWTLL